MLWVAFCFAIMLVIETGVLFFIRSPSTGYQLCYRISLWCCSDIFPFEKNFTAVINWKTQTSWTFVLADLSSCRPTDELFHTLQFCHFHNDSVLLRCSENKGLLESKSTHFSSIQQIVFCQHWMPSGQQKFASNAVLVCQVFGGKRRILRTRQKETLKGTKQTHNTKNLSLS